MKAQAAQIADWLKKLGMLCLAGLTLCNCARTILPDPAKVTLDGYIGHPVSEVSCALGHQKFPSVWVEARRRSSGISRCWVSRGLRRRRSTRANADLMPSLLSPVPRDRVLHHPTCRLGPWKHGGLAGPSAYDRPSKLLENALAASSRAGGPF